VQPPAQWPASRLANQLLIVIGTFTAPSQLTQEAAAGAGGLTFLGHPSASRRTAVRAGVAALAAAAAAAGQIPPWMSSTTEGGAVTRLGGVLGPLPSARAMAATMSPTAVQGEMEARAGEMRGLGITMDLAPVLDVSSATNQVADEGQRSFSATAAVAASYGVAFAAGLRAGGVVAVGKHFPGLGRASADTDTAPATDPPLPTLEADDLVPFEKAVAAGLPAVMVGHAVVPDLTGGLPASVSPATYRLLRQTLHFSGVAMTDSLVAKAISAAGYTEASAAVAAIEAGGDMAIVDEASWPGAVAQLEGAISSGALPASQVEASVGRILAAKGAAVCAT
jgi:beta-N-acetylhexosaminidase